MMIMKMKKLPQKISLLAILLMCVSSISAQQVTGASSPLTVNPCNFTIIDPSLQVSGSGNITDFTVQIVGNYYLGDELSFEVEPGRDGPVADLMRISIRVELE